MTTVTSSYVPVWRFADNNNNPLVGGKVYTYYAGTTTPAATYTDATGTTPLTNPIILNARGETANSSGQSCGVWFSTTIAYKIVVQDSVGNLIWTVDNYTIPSQAYSSAYADTFTSTAGQTVFTLTGTVGSLSALDVSLDGSTLVNGVDFTWTAPSTLTLTVGARVGQTLLVKYLLAQAMGVLVAGGTNGQILYNNGGSVQGFTMSGDVTVVPTTGVTTINAPSSRITYTQGGTGSVTRTATAKLQENVSVADFGADPTGVADSTTAFNNAFTAWAGVGTLSIPPGTFLLNSTLTAPANPTNGIVQGASSSETILKFTNAGNGLVMSSNQSVKNLQIQTTNASAGIGLRISGLNQNISGVQITRSGSGVWAKGIQCYGTVTTLIQNCYINSNAATIGMQVINNGANAVGALTLIGNEIRAVTTGLNITTDGFSSSVGALAVNIYGGAIENCGTTGLLIDYTTTSVSNNVAIYGTHFEQNTTNDIKMTSHGMLTVYSTQHIAGATNAIDCSGVQTNTVVRFTGINVYNYAGGAISLGANIAFGSVTGCSMKGAQLTNSAASKIMLLDNYFFDGTYTGNILPDDGSGYSILGYKTATYTAKGQLQNSTGAFQFFNNGANSYQIDSANRLNLYNKLYPAQDTAATQSVAGLYAGTGLPSNSNGNNGDFYFRGDTPGTANQRLYVKSAGSWVGIA